MGKFWAVACLCATALLALPAHADTTYQFTFSTTGPDAGSFSFALSSTTPYTSKSGYDFDYTNIHGTVNGVSDTFTDIDFEPTGNGEPITVTDGNFHDLLYFSNVLTGTPNGMPPTIQLGQSTGVVVCSASLRSPFVSSGLPATMAFFQMQFPFSYSCEEQVNLSVTNPTTPAPSSVTPEPASLGLLATGALGMVTLLRRRLA